VLVLPHALHAVPRAQLDPLLHRYEQLADESGELMKDKLVQAVPALASSPFFKAIEDMLVEDGSGGQAKAGSISRERFITVLSRFCEGSPIETKLRGMFELFRSAGGGGGSGGGSSEGEDALTRADITSLMNALYAQESPTMVHHARAPCHTTEPLSPSCRAAPLCPARMHAGPH
jgi:hypothetical protein